MNIRLHSILLLMMLPCCLSAQTPGVEWQHCFGTACSQMGYSVALAADGGYVIAGSDSCGVGNHGGYDVAVVKVSESGTLLWQHCYGGSSYDEAQSVKATPDGGFIVAGYTFSHDGDITYNHGGKDYWLLKLSAEGAIEWQRTYGGEDDDAAYSVSVASDGGYIVNGSAKSSGGDVTGHRNYMEINPNIWVVRLDINGNILWQRSVDIGNGYDVRETPERGFVCTGFLIFSRDQSSQVTKFYYNGDIEWQHSFRGHAMSIQPVDEDGFVLAGNTEYADTTIPNMHNRRDVWVARLSNTGSMVWQKAYGGSSEDLGYSVIRSADSNYIVSGITASVNGDVTGPMGAFDAWVMKLNPNGDTLWQKCLGGTAPDYARCIIETKKGTFAVAGYSSSHDYGLDNKGQSDFWIAKLKEPQTDKDTIEIPPVNPVVYTFSVYPNPSSDILHIVVPGTDKEPAHVVITNVWGQRVVDTFIPENSPTDINLDVASAMYFLVAETGKERFVRKIIKSPNH